MTLTLVRPTGHVIYKTNNLADGFIPDSQISASIDVVNADYASCGISFHLAGTDRTLNGDWFDALAPNRQVNSSYGFLPTVVDVTFRSTLQTAMKTQLRQGGADALNVYSVGFATGAAAGYLGYSTFPTSYASNPKDDGVVILYSSVPGGTRVPYDKGRTLTHEAG